MTTKIGIEEVGSDSPPTSKSALTVQEYEIHALGTDRRSNEGSLAFPLLGLFGEAGSLLSEVKKKQRDKVTFASYSDAVIEELGDVMWYLTALCSRANLSLAEVVHKAVYEECGRDNDVPIGLRFGNICSTSAIEPIEPTPAFEKTLMELAAKIGGLVSDYQDGGLITDRTKFGDQLAGIMRTLSRAANEAGVTLEAAARGNLYKIYDRWPREKNYPSPFDQFAPEPERLPRTLSIEIFEREVSGRKYVFQRCNGINIGDRLTDNAMTPDDYRFHDVFHYAYASILTWSPVLRALLRLKRKSDPNTDDAEDGARAILIEEGVATWIFGQAKAQGFFENMERGSLPLSLLKHVRKFVAGYEAARCPLWLWEEAILQGYDAFRFLKERRRGLVRLDMDSRQLSIEVLPS